MRQSRLCRSVQGGHARRAAFATLLVLGLAGCAGAPAPVVTATVTVTPSPPPAPTPAATPTPTAEAPLVPSPPNPAMTPNADAAPAQPLPEGPAEDLGAGPGAHGSASANAAGGLLLYTVVEGDSFFDIAQRFNVPMQQLLRMNPSIPGLGEDIYLRQQINLDWKSKK